MSPSSTPFPPYQVRSLPVGISLCYSLPLSSVPSPSRCLPPPHHSHPIKCALSQSVTSTSTPFPFHSQVRSLQVGVSLPHTTPTLKCALSQSVSPSSTPIALSSALSPSLHLSLLFPSTLKCALSQSVSSSTPFPPYQVCSLPVGVSLPYTIPLSGALSSCKTIYKMSPSSVRSEGGEAAAGYCLNSVSYRVDEAVKYNVLNSD